MANGDGDGFGDGGGFDAAFAGLARQAYSTAFRILGDREDAEDVALETLARIEQRWDRVTGDRAAWVTTVAAHQALDLWRRNQRRRRPAASGAMAQESEASGSDGEGSAVERLDLVRELRGLPRRQRDAVVLRYFADLSQNDTATTMGVSPGTAKQHIHRGLARLQQLHGHGEGDEHGHV